MLLPAIASPIRIWLKCLFRLIKSKLPEVRVLMVTVYNDSEQIFRVSKAGANGYLIKSSPPEELLAAIRDVQNGSAPLSGPIALKVVEHFHEMGPPAKETENLSTRERQVLDLIAKGFIYKEIGAQLGIEVGTVRSYVKNMPEAACAQPVGGCCRAWMNEAEGANPR